MANMRTVEKTSRIVTPLSYAREFGGKAWLAIEPSRPHDYASVVLWKIAGVWVHKGWLMPEVPYSD